MHKVAGRRQDRERGRRFGEVKLALARDVETEHYLGDRETGGILSDDHLWSVRVQEPLAYCSRYDDFADFQVPKTFRQFFCWR